MARKKATAEDKSTTRERLLEAGRDLFATKTFDQVSVDDITNRAGVAHGLLFHYFKTKLDLYLEVYKADRDENLRRRLEVTGTGTPQERLEKFVAFHMGHLREWSAVHSFMLRGGAPAKVIALAETYRMIGVREVLSYFSSDPPTDQQLTLGRAWLSMMGEIVLVWLQGGKLDERGVHRTCVELYHEMMARAPVLKLKQTPSSASATPRARSSIKQNPTLAIPRLPQRRSDAS